MKLTKTLLISLALTFTCCSFENVNDWSAIAQKTLDTTVFIEGTIEVFDPDLGEIDTKLGIGSGVVISEDGWILTNAHVVSGRFGQFEEIKITLRSGKEFFPQQVFLFPKEDIAILKIDATELNFITLRFIPLKAGEPCLAVGNPFPFKFVVKEGIVSGVRFEAYRPFGMDISDSGDYAGFLVHSATIAPGNSGGPVVDVEGNLIGINNAYLRSVPFYALAIPLGAILPVLDTITIVNDKAPYTLAPATLGTLLDDFAAKIIDKFL